MYASRAVVVRQARRVAVANATTLRQTSAVLICPDLAPSVTTVSGTDVVHLARLYAPVQQNAIIPRHKDAASKPAVLGPVPSIKLVVAQDIATINPRNDAVRMELAQPRILVARISAAAHSHHVAVTASVAQKLHQRQFLCPRQSHVPRRLLSPRLSSNPPQFLDLPHHLSGPVQPVVQQAQGSATTLPISRSANVHSPSAALKKHKQTVARCQYGSSLQ